MAKQLGQGVAQPWFGFHHQATVINGQADSCAGLQVQLIEKRWRDGQRDRAAHFAQIWLYTWRKD